MVSVHRELTAVPRPPCLGPHDNKLMVGFPIAHLRFIFCPLLVIEYFSGEEKGEYALGGPKQAASS